MFCLKPCVVQIEKWIASNEVQENDKENVCHVVNCEGVSETNRKTSSSDEADKGSPQKLLQHMPQESPRESVDHIDMNVNSGIDDNKGNSLPQPLKSNISAEVQKLIDNSVATLLFDMIRTAKIDGISDMNTGETQSDLPYSVASSSQNSPCSFQSVSSTGLFEDIEQERNKSLTETTQSINKIAEDDIPLMRGKSATASTSNIFELGHLLYDEMVNETGPIGVEECGEENNNDSYHCDRAISENRSQQNMPATDRGISPSVPANSQSNYDSIDQTDHHSEFVGFNQDEDDDDNGPIDYSMSVSYQYQYHESVLDLSKKNSRFSVSPAAELRSGFGGSVRQIGRDFQFPKKFCVDERQKTNQSSLHCPDPQIPRSAFKRLPSYEISKKLSVPEVAPLMMDNRDLSKANITHKDATNGVSGSTSGTRFETVEACSQTDAESAKNIFNDTNYVRFIVDCNHFYSTVLFQFLHNSMIQREGFNSLMSSNAVPPSTNQSNSQICSNQRTSNQSTNTRIESDSGVKKQRFSKRIRAKQSEHMEGASKTVIKNKISRKADNVAPIPPKRMKKIKSNEVRFDIENLENQEIQTTRYDWFNGRPRKINFKFSSRSKYPETPKRLSTYMRTVNSCLQSTFK